MVLHLRSHSLYKNEAGYATWREHETRSCLEASKVCVIVCDMWDRNWSRAANERAESIARRVDAFLMTARDLGVHVVHAPSETMRFYEDHPSRRRARQTPLHLLPPEHPRDVPVLPVDDSDGGSDTNWGDEKIHTVVWSRQTPLIGIDEDRDIISDDPQEIHNFRVAHRIELSLILGVHVNMCILDRPFAIMSCVRRGLPIALVRDLTDALYSPTRPPYVDHETGTALMISYIEKFWCPTVTSAQVLGTAEI
jgi:hypothetical protein